MKIEKYGSTVLERTFLLLFLPGRREPINESEHVDSAIGTHGQTKEEAKGAGADDNQGLPLPKLGPLVHGSSGQGLSHGELTVQAQGDQHEEEHEGEELGSRHPGHGLRVGNESKTWT